MFSEIMSNMSGSEKSEMRNFMNIMKEGIVSKVIDDIGDKFVYDSEEVLSVFVLTTNTPLIFDLFKVVIANAYGDSGEIEEIIDDLKAKTEKMVEEEGLPW